MVLSSSLGPYLTFCRMQSLSLSTKRTVKSHFGLVVSSLHIRDGPIREEFILNPFIRSTRSIYWDLLYTIHHVYGFEGDSSYNYLVLYKTFYYSPGKLNILWDGSRHVKHNQWYFSSYNIFIPRRNSRIIQFYKDTIEWLFFLGSYRVHDILPTAVSRTCAEFKSLKEFFFSFAFLPQCIKCFNW